MTVLDRFRLDGKRLLITGGSRGFGRAIALAAAEAGADIMLVARDPDALAKTADEVRERGRQAWTFAADIADPAACEDLCRRALAEGRADRHSRQQCRRPQSRRRDREHRPRDLAAIRRSQSDALLHLHEDDRRRDAGARSGRVINIASISGLIANRGIGGRHYETTKAAVIHFTRAAAADWAPRGVTVNAICPGLFMTEPNRSGRRRTRR